MVAKRYLENYVKYLIIFTENLNYCAIIHRQKEQPREVGVLNVYLISMFLIRMIIKSIIKTKNYPSEEYFD